jgi:hypothetical protein
MAVMVFASQRIPPAIALKYIYFQYLDHAPRRHSPVIECRIAALIAHKAAQRQAVRQNR